MTRRKTPVVPCRACSCCGRVRLACPHCGVPHEIHLPKGFVLPATSPPVDCGSCGKALRLQVNGWIGSDNPRLQRLEQTYADSPDHG